MSRQTYNQNEVDDMLYEERIVARKEANQELFKKIEDIAYRCNINHCYQQTRGCKFGDFNCRAMQYLGRELEK